MKIQDKRETEKETIHFMISLYCRKKHHQTLCVDCEELYAYACKRIELCPFMETKTFCSNCKVHCYEAIMQQRIKEVMRFSGPYMVIYHPIMALHHLYASRKEQRK